MVKDASLAECYELPYRAGKASTAKCRLRVSTFLTAPSLIGDVRDSSALKLIAGFNKSVYQTTWRKVRQQGATGMFGFTSIQPDVAPMSQDELDEAALEHDGDESMIPRCWRWRYVHRSLVVSSTDVQLAPIKDRRWRSELLGQHELGKAFARFAKYLSPLVRKLPGTIVDCLEGIEDGRLFQTFGALSQRSELRLSG